MAKILGTAAKVALAAAAAGALVVATCVFAESTRTAPAPKRRR
ncbi:hypothetical protein [Arabiibacter massiliensis]|nr:hypothetical protein [Arabiibacter massiliensis]